MGATLAREVRRRLLREVCGAGRDAGQRVQQSLARRDRAGSRGLGRVSARCLMSRSGHGRGRRWFARARRGGPRGFSSAVANRRGRFLGAAANCQIRRLASRWAFLGTSPPLPLWEGLDIALLGRLRGASPGWWPWSGHHLVVGRGLAGTLTRTWSRVLASVDRRQEGGIGGTKFSGAPPRRSIIS